MPLKEDLCRDKSMADFCDEDKSMADFCDKDKSTGEVCADFCDEDKSMGDVFVESTADGDGMVSRCSPCEEVIFDEDGRVGGVPKT